MALKKKKVEKRNELSTKIGFIVVRTRQCTYTHTRVLRVRRKARAVTESSTHRPNDAAESNHARNNEIIQSHSTERMNSYAFSVRLLRDIQNCAPPRQQEQRCSHEVLLYNGRFYESNSQIKYIYLFFLNFNSSPKIDDRPLSRSYRPISSYLLSNIFHNAWIILLYYHSNIIIP